MRTVQEAQHLHSRAACQKWLRVRWGLDLRAPLNGRAGSLRGWEEGVFDSSSFGSSMKSWIYFWGRISFCFFSCRYGMERTLLQWLPTDFSKSAASQGNPCSLSLCLNCLYQKRMGLPIFIPFSCSCGTGVASPCPCWSSRDQLGLCWMLSQRWSVTPVLWPLLSTPLPGFTAVYQAAPASVLFTDSHSLMSVFYLFLWEAAGYEEPLLLFCSPELDFLGHISDL